MGRAAVSEQHALVLINKGNATGHEILALADAIQTSVRDRFGIELEPEPLIIRS
jgi:UDP-N-acetylmuramate dehydrogenase